MSLFGDQLSLFSSSSLSGASDLFWGELEGEDSPLPSPVTETPLVIPQTDFRLTGSRGLATSWKDRARDNIAAISLLGTLEAEDRNAIPDEQAVLSRFIGFGAGELANALFPRGGEPYRAGWESLGKALEAACSETEHAALARSTQYAHYTPEHIVTAIWDMLVKRGFQGGSVLEPGCGIGQFIALRPERLEGRIAFTGIEMDSIAARIARKLYPRQWIRQEDFTKATLASDYDLAIGNPPFSNRLVNTPEQRDLRGFSLHDWFIARSLSALRPGGFAAFVTSRHTLDKTDQKARQHIAEEADLLGAVRLPAGVMSAEAGTEVVLDLLVFRKRMIGELPGDQTWLETAVVPESDEGRGPLWVNRYFLDNPAQVLGQHGWAGSQFGLDYCCLPVAGVDLQTALPEALARIAPESRFLPPAEQRITRPELDGLSVGTAASGALARPDLVARALEHKWHGPVVTPHWIMPAGAFGESVGPG